MYNKILISITTLILACCFSACQKSSVATTSVDDVSIVVNSPKANDVYKKGDMINIDATITYQGQLHGYIVRISDNEGTVHYETEGHNHSDNITVAEQWKNTVSTNTMLTMELICVMDHDEKLKTTKVEFQNQP